MSWDISHKALTYERLKDFLAYVGASENEIQSELPNKLCLKKSFFIRDNFRYFHELANERGIYIKKYSVGSSEENASAYNENLIVIEPDIAYYMPNTPQPTELCSIYILALNDTTYNGTSYSDTNNPLVIKVDKGSDWTSGTFAPPSDKQGTFTVTLNGNNYTLQDNRVILLNIVNDLYLVSSFIEEEPPTKTYLVKVLTDEHSYYNNKTEDTLATVSEGGSWSMPIATIINNLSFLTGYELDKITVSDGMTKDDTSCSVLSATKNYVILVTSKEKPVIPDSIVISINLPSTCLDPNAKVLINNNGDNSIIVIKENNLLISSETFNEVSSYNNILNNGDYYLEFYSGNLDGQTGLYTDAKYTKLHVKLNNTTYTLDILLCVLPYFGYTGTNVNIDWENTKYLTQGSNATCTVTLSDTSDVNKFIGSLILSSGYETIQSNNPIKFTYEKLETTLTGTLQDNLTLYTLIIKSPYECSLTFTNILSFLNIEAITSNSSSDWWDDIAIGCSKIVTLERILKVYLPCSGGYYDVIVSLSFDDFNDLNIADLNVGFFGPYYDSDYSKFLGRFKIEEQNKQTLYDWLPLSIDYEGINYSRGPVSMECSDVNVNEKPWWKPCSECTLQIDYSKDYETESYGNANIMGAETSDPDNYEQLVCIQMILGDECHNRIITGEELYNLKCQCNTGEGEGLTTVLSVKLGGPPINGSTINSNAKEINRNWISTGSKIREDYPIDPTFYIIYTCGSGSGEDYATLSCAYISNFSITYTSTNNTPSLGTDITINGDITLVYDDSSTSTTTISDLGPKVSVIPNGETKWRIKISPMSIGDVQVKSGSCEGNTFEYDKVIDFSQNPPAEV